MSAITTHVLDTSRGRPAAGVPVTLAMREDHGEFSEIGSGATDADGRLRTLVPGNRKLERGIYRLTFDTSAYFASIGVHGFYPEVSIVFEVSSADEHYHVPLLLNA